MGRGWGKSLVLLCVAARTSAAQMFDAWQVCRSPCEGWPTEHHLSTTGVLSVSNTPNTFPNNSSQRQAYGVKSRDVVMLKPNNVCHVHPKC